jgi:hypothetical protein
MHRTILTSERTVNRFVIAPLVLLLSGVPATAIVCDLVLCSDRATPAAASTGCHDHTAPDSGKRVTPRPDDCSHISQVEPYVASASRVVYQPVGSAPAGSASHVAARSHDGVNTPSAHGVPVTPPTTSFLPLRI